jgi:hypothetical protein
LQVLEAAGEGCSAEERWSVLILRKKKRWNINHVTASKASQDKEPASDRGSIKFLLNSGTASFVECFRFPSENERRNLFNFRNTRTGSADSTILDFFGNGSDNGSTFSDPFEEEPIDWSLFEDENLLRFLSSPFSPVQMSADDMFAPLFMDSNYTNSAPIDNLAFTGEWEPASVQSSAMVQFILEKAVSLQLNPQEQADIQHHLNFLFTPSKITKLVNLYFEFWHPHCPIVHQPTFIIDTAPIPLLLAVTLMGAMYSQADKEVNTAKVILDLAELAIYSVEDLTDEFEIRQMLRASSMPPPLEPSTSTSPLVFSHLHAAYLMVVVQFWAGNMVSRKRAIETRFGVVVKIARRLGLTKARHDLEDSVDESLWIQKESKIRYIPSDLLRFLLYAHLSQVNQYNDSLGLRLLFLRQFPMPAYPVRDEVRPSLRRDIFLLCPPLLREKLHVQSSYHCPRSISKFVSTESDDSSITSWREEESVRPEPYGYVYFDTQ